MVSSWTVWNLKHDGFPQWFSRCTNTSQVHIAYVFTWGLPPWLWQQEYVTQCVISIRCYLLGMTLLFGTDPDSRSITHITLGSCGLVVRIQHHCSPITVSLGDLSEISCLSWMISQKSLAFPTSLPSPLQTEEIEINASEGVSPTVLRLKNKKGPGEHFWDP